MKTPRLNRRLTLETPKKVSDGAGGYNTTWAPLGQLWAALMPRGGGESGADGATVSAVSYQIVVRGAPQGSPSRPRPEQRFREGGRVFNIRAVTERDDRGMYLTCFADEEVVA
jgi:SPP1 family predicted phage head-tail adaptor